MKSKKPHHHQPLQTHNLLKHNSVLLWLKEMSPKVLALCCSHLQTAAQIALTRLVSNGVVVHMSMDRGELQE